MSSLFEDALNVVLKTHQEEVTKLCDFYEKKIAHYEKEIEYLRKNTVDSQRCATATIDAANKQPKKKPKSASKDDVFFSSPPEEQYVSTRKNHTHADSLEQNTKKRHKSPPRNEVENVQAKRSSDSYKFIEPVRKKSDREYLHGFDCRECEMFYKLAATNDAQRAHHQNHVSRHRAAYAPPSTPPRFWELGFPDSQE